MHACGHDSHTAMALGAALLLSKEKLPGRVRFLFQPCEETTDEEGLSGAQRMAAEGAMDGVDYIIAQHVDPTRPVGTIGINAGPNSGGVDNWYATIRGKGGHGAHPDKTVDPYYLMSHVIIALNAIVSRRIDPFEPAAVSIGTVQGGFTENVIPESVKLTGTLRYTSEAVHRQIHEEIRRSFELVKALGGEYELKFEHGGPPMINDKLVAEVIEKAGKDLLGADNVHEIQKTLGAEDFGEFLKLAPGAMFTLGTQKQGHEEYLLHHPRFDLDERALPVGTAMLVESAKRFLNNPEPS
jgi:amidohydrolase